MLRNFQPGQRVRANRSLMRGVLSGQELVVNGQADPSFYPFTLSVSKPSEPSVRFGASPEELDEIEEVR